MDTQKDLVFLYRQTLKQSERKAMERKYHTDFLSQFNAGIVAYINTHTSKPLDYESLNNHLDKIAMICSKNKKSPKEYLGLIIDLIEDVLNGDRTYYKNPNQNNLF